MSSCQRTKEPMRNLCALLNCVPMTTYNETNWKRPRVTIMHFYKIIRFHVRRCFCSRLSVRGDSSGQPIKCTIKYLTIKICHKLHHWIPTRTTRNYTLLHNPTILHIKIVSAPAYHPRKKIFSETKLSHSPLYTHTRFTRHLPLINTIHSGRHHPGCLWIFELKKTSKKKYLYGKNELDANFHVMCFIYLLLLSLLRYPLRYISPM